MQTKHIPKLLLLLAVSLSAAAAQRGGCQCQPTWQCPQAFAVFPVRTCVVRGFLRGVCCPQTTPRPTTPPPARDCTPLVLCPGALANPKAFSRMTCRLRDGSQGVMCSTRGIIFGAPPSVGTRDGISGRRRAMQPLGEERQVTEAFMTVTGGDERAAAASAERAVQEQTQLGTRLGTSARGSTVGIFNLNFRSNRAEQDLGMTGLQNLLALSSINQQGGGSTVQLTNRFGFSQPADTISPSRPSRIPGCENEESIFCTASRFRTANGECNNLDRPRQGRALTGFKRLLANTYADNIFEPRRASVTGRPLPSARLISERVVETISNELSGFTLSVMQWGQFIDHDFNHALIFQLPDGGAIQCCQNDGQTLPTTPLHPQCIPIEIPANDPFYSRFGQRCMSLVRSLPAPEPDCIARPATPINELTAYLDASMLYGSQDEETDRLRTFQNGLLIVSRDNLLPLSSTPSVPRPISLTNRYRFPGGRGGRRGQTTARPTPAPIEEEEGDSCVDSARVCFRGGESRVNEQSALTVMHTLFTREHNRVATALRRRHADWDDERLFQEARRIVIAEWQHIVYNEWLPIVVGFDYARDHDLLPLQSGFSQLYDATVDASASNEFATAAFRFGHSLLRDMYHLINAQGAVTRSVNLTRTFFDPTVVADGFVEHARTLVARRPETFDTNIISSVHEQLFTSNFRFGLDLIALNIQRGRDHGIPTYTSVLRACNDITIDSWNALSAVMDQQAIKNLRSVYDDPRDVDLFIGGLSERRARGAQVGPTFQCLIGQQFFDVRYGDRFFYDIGGMDHSFTEPQLAEIRKSSWARMMCDTLGTEFGGDFSRVQPLAFVESTVGPNGQASCSSAAIPRMNLDVF
ncbi:peroxidase-like [Amphibalanus amphitrite]|uniref:peroxidase-like n=1 Tax=Amphibalanus amphitrite TaxID=1232801 RepID=UPI001C922617|nr:peroxidase-like [Amphibalanus amphitrite]